MGCDSKREGLSGVTWAVLLGRWVDFARGALALPDDAAGRRLRASVSDIIMLQAVWHALGEVGDLDDDQRALGLDRAEVLIDKHTAALRERYRNESLPEMLAELIIDSRERLREKSDLA